MSNHLNDEDYNESLLTREQKAKDSAIGRIKSLRTHLDGVADLVSIMNITDDPQALMYLMSTHNSLLMCKAHLGMVLGGLGNASPYTNDGKRHSIADVEPTADKAGLFFVEGWTELNAIEQLDSLRQQLKSVLEEAFWPIYEKYDELAGNTFSGRTLRRWWDAEKYLIESRIYLGYVLQELAKPYKIS